MRQSHWFAGIIVMLLAAGSIGCGQSMRPFSVQGVDTSLNVESDDQMSKAEKAAQDAQAAIDEANVLLAQVTDDNGNIKIGLFQKHASGASAQGVLDPILNQLRAVFDKVYQKILLVKQQFPRARQALNDALAKIDQSNPANAAQVALIMAQLAKIDQLEAQFSNSMHTLASKLDLVSAGLDAIAKGIITFIPGFGSLIGLALDFLIMDDVKNLIMELKAKLMAL